MLSPSNATPANSKSNMEPPSIPRMQQSSATGNPRNKVSLAPGHSLMDWIRLANSGRDLTGVGGILQVVTPEQLAQHSTRDDAWLAIRDKVYNVSHYMDFHPGGAEELMRGAGTDATKLFTEVHAWVNYDSILQKCLVGRFRPRGGGGGDDGGGGDGVLGSPNQQQGGLLQFLATKEEKAPVKAKRNLAWDWYEQEDQGSVVLYCRSHGPCVRVALGEDDRDLRIEVREAGTLYLLHFTLAGPIVWPARVIQIANSSKVELQLKKQMSGMWKHIGVKCEDSDSEVSIADKPIIYSTMQISHITRVNHNTQLLVLKQSERIISTTPVGHHIRVRAHIEGQEVVRCYTPVTPGLVDSPRNRDPTLLHLLVKHYENGVLSSWLASQPVGASVQVSVPEGTFQTNCLSDRKELYLLAAGTGFTPMVGLINWARSCPFSKWSKIVLMFFNRTEEDILWHNELEQLSRNDSRFSAKHILSEADEKWTGLHGHVNGEMLRSLLPGRSPQTEPQFYVCVCGPVPFTQLTKGLLHLMDYTEQDFHCFLG